MNHPNLRWVSIILGLFLQVFFSYLSAEAFLSGHWASGMIFFFLVLLLGFGIVFLIVRSREKRGPKDSSFQGLQ